MFAAIGIGFGLVMWAELFPGDRFAFAAVELLAATIAAVVLTGMRYIPNNRVGIVEKLWSPKGSVTEGRIMALSGEAGFQANLLLLL